MYIDSMMKSQIDGSGQLTGYGMGWYTETDERGKRIWYHSGDSFTGSSGIMILPDDRIVVAFLANSQAGLQVNLRELAGYFINSNR
jgi:CubicO group peptidase (beta-lactamase class C family)